MDPAVSLHDCMRVVVRHGAASGPKKISKRGHDGGPAMRACAQSSGSDTHSARLPGLTSTNKKQESRLGHMFHVQLAHLASVCKRDACQLRTVFKREALTALVHIGLKELEMPGHAVWLLDLRAVDCIGPAESD